MVAFSANSAPSGYLLCNGSAVSRTTYSALFAKIGTLYGTGDGSTTFTLPNLTDRVIWGSGTAGTVKAAGLPNITGNADTTRWGYIGVNTSSGALSLSQSSNNSSDFDTGYKGVKLNFNAKNSNSIYGASSTVQPPALTMRYYIKY